MIEFSEDRKEKMTDEVPTSSNSKGCNSMYTAVIT